MVKYLEFIKAGISQKIAIIFKINIERTKIKDLPKKSMADLSTLGTLAPPPPPPPDNPPLANNYWPPTPVSNTGSNSNPSYYSHYSNSFVKGGSLLPP